VDDLWMMPLPARDASWPRFLCANAQDAGLAGGDYDIMAMSLPRDRLGFVVPPPFRIVVHSLWVTCQEPRL
jgi:hypothetical protein